MRAQVKWFNPEKGFGVLVPEDRGPDHYFHITDLDTDAPNRGVD